MLLLVLIVLTFNFDIITDMFTDAFVTYAVECLVKYAQESQTVYQYRYSHLGQYGLNTDQGLPKYGVNHADELYLMWDPVYYQHRPLNPSDQRMSGILMKAWSSFIKTSDPGSGWEPASSGKYLRYRNSMRLYTPRDVPSVHMNALYILWRNDSNIWEKNIP